MTKQKELEKYFVAEFTQEAKKRFTVFEETFKGINITTAKRLAKDYILGYNDNMIADGAKPFTLTNVRVATASEIEEYEEES